MNEVLQKRKQGGEIMISDEEIIKAFRKSENEGKAVRVIDKRKLV